MKISLKEKIESLGLSFKNEMIKAGLINVVFIGSAIASYFFLKQIYIFIFVLFIDLAANFFFFTRYSDIEKRNNISHDSEFISLLSYFEIFISNKKNVYNSLQLIMPYSSLWMQDKLETLLKQIDQDKTVKPFINFSNNFANKVIQSVMLSIFQMVENGENSDSMNQFNALFVQMSNNEQISKVKTKEQKLESLNSLPLFGAGAICIVLVFSILAIVGEMVNGI